MKESIKDSLTEFEELELHYVDLRGILHSLSTPPSVLMDNHILVDGSSVLLARVEDSDLRLVPDIRTLRRIPWDPKKGRLICNIASDGEGLFWGDSRKVASRVTSYLREQGLRELAGVELEFFIHKVKVNLSRYAQSVEIINGEKPLHGLIGMKNMYEIAEPYDTQKPIRDKIVKYASSLGVEVIAHHHEVATNQSEISVAARESTELGDAVATLKFTARRVASEFGYVANFMPKPIHGENGSGMHVHLSLWSNGRNIFFDPEEGLSQAGRYFIGGLIEHGRALSAIVAPTVNSYRRLVPGYEAPTLLAWGYSNRTAAIRIPKVMNERKFRVEFRPPDPSANPYLAIAAILMAGLDGMRKKIDPGDPVGFNLYNLSSWRLRELGVKSLPTSLSEALDELESDSNFLKPVFPEELISKYIELKRNEVREIASYPTPAEFSIYLLY